MTRWKFSRNQIKDYAVIDNKVYNLDIKVYYHQKKILWILWGVMILIFLSIVIIVYKRNINVYYISLICLGIVVLNAILQYIVNTLLLPKDIENFVTLDQECETEKNL